MDKQILRQVGEALAALETQLPRGLYSALDPLLKVINKDLPDQAYYTLRLAYYIQWMKQATDAERVGHLLEDAYEMIGACRPYNREELDRARANTEVAGLLVYIDDDTWGPGSATNTSHQALMLSARQALGRIKNIRRAG